jgi:hypothetical protein
MHVVESPAGNSHLGFDPHLGPRMAATTPADQTEFYNSFSDPITPDLVSL